MRAALIVITALAFRLLPCIGQIDGYLLRRARTSRARGKSRVAAERSDTLAEICVYALVSCINRPEDGRSNWPDSGHGMHDLIEDEFEAAAWSRGGPKWVAAFVVSFG
jgi:hypothetical protein